MHFLRIAALDIHLKMAHLDTTLYLIRDNAAQRVCNVSICHLLNIYQKTLLQWLLWFRSKCTSGLDGCKMYCSKKERNKKNHNGKKNVFKNKASLLKAFGRFWSSVFCTWGFQK